MSDLEDRIQHVLDASVATVEPPPDLIQVVQRRYRRRMARAALASAAAVAVIAAGVALTGLPGRAGSAAGQRHSHAPTHRASVFPGGGRLLFAGRRGLKWLYPDGSIVRIASGFSDAQVSGTELVAWNSTGVYTMGLDGTRQHLAVVLQPGSASSFPQTGALSPGGVRIAYYVGRTLWAADLTTGRRVGLGQVVFEGWRNDATILASATTGRELLLINAATGYTSGYLSIADPALRHAYQHAWPHSAAPAGITSEGFSGSGISSALAITLSAHGRYGGARPAWIIRTRTGRLFTYTPPAPQLSEFSWGPHGLFRIETGAGDNPASWNAYIGAVQDNRLSAPIGYGADGVAFNPAGTVIAFQDSNQITFLPVPQPACRATACLHFQLKYLVNQGRLITWAP